MLRCPTIRAMLRCPTIRAMLRCPTMRAMLRCPTIRAMLRCANTCATVLYAPILLSLVPVLPTLSLLRSRLHCSMQISVHQMEEAVLGMPQVHA